MKHLMLISSTLLIASLAKADTFCGSGSPAIPDGTGNSVEWTIEVTSDGIVTDARFFTQITHPWVGDLRMELTAPDGMMITLMDRPGMPEGGWIGPWGCGGDDVNGMFNDEADTAAEEMCSTSTVPVIAGNVLPAEPLSALDGHPAQGTWTIAVFDDSPVDSGTIQQLCLVLSLDEDCNGNGIGDGQDIAEGESQDVNGNGIPDECECPADLNGDQMINVEDVLQVIAAFGETNSEADIDGNGQVDIGDILLVIEGWGIC
ncbi:MAG: proprotein convertase P-domain-containing protein [Phycisphaerales bacterium]|nr:proprotein convertase P-domain-containing protein [Phycisphaerales bacterium]